MTTKRRGLRRAIFAIFLVALALRVWGSLGQGLPHCFYPDEENNVERALAMGARKSLDPHWFNKPALGYYVVFGEYGLYYLVGTAFGRFDGPEDLALEYFEDPTAFYLIGRLSTALFGALTVLLIYRLGALLGGRALGVSSALILCFTYGHVATSQQVKMDVPCAFFTVWAILFVLRVMKFGRWRDYVGAGVLAGLGMATKYYSVALLVPLLFAHLFRGPRAVERSPRVILSPRLVVAFFAFVGGFFLGSPYNFLNPMWFNDIFLPRLSWLGSRAWFLAVAPPRGEPGAGSVLDHLEFLAGNVVHPRGMGPILTGFLVVGAGALLVRRRRSRGLLLFALVFLTLFVAVASVQKPEPRHLSTVYPLAAIVAAFGFRAVARAAARRWDLTLTRGRCLAALTGLVLLPIPAFPAFEVVALNVERGSEDPRVDVVRWLREKVPADACIINNLQWRLNPSVARCEWVPMYAAKLARNGAISPVRRDTYDRRWRFAARAASTSGKGWDVIPLHGAWQTETLAKRQVAAASYNPIWPRSPWGDHLNSLLAEHGLRNRERRAAGGAPQLLTATETRARFRERVGRIRPRERDLHPVEFWTRPTSVSVRWLTKREGERPPFQAAQWLISARSTFENYETPQKRQHFPDFADFFDDLRAHYHCFEFNSHHPDPEKVIRVWDLRRRVEKGTVTRVPHGGR